LSSSIWSQITVLRDAGHKNGPQVYIPEDADVIYFS